MANETVSAPHSHHTLAKLALAIGAVMVLLRLWRLSRATDFRGRSIIITGGSRGLGLALARRLVQEGARVALLARSEHELEKAEAQLDGLGGEVMTVVCDITKPAEAEAAVERVLLRFGSIDGLINNAGTIEVGPVENMDEADYQTAMDLHVWAPLRLIRLVAPHMKAGGVGRVVNIASFGGLIAMPHMAPYSITKFGTVGLSDAMRTELFKDGILVTTVCPGVIKTGSHVQARFKGHQRAEYTLFKLAGLMPGTPDSNRAAGRIVDAMRHGDPELIFPAPLRWVYLLKVLFPNTAGLALGISNRFMPAPAPSEDGNKSLSGRDVEGMLPDSVLSKLNLKAVIENNQMNGHSLEKKASEN